MLHFDNCYLTVICFFMYFVKWVCMLIPYLSTVKLINIEKYMSMLLSVWSTHNMYCQVPKVHEFYNFASVILYTNSWNGNKLFTHKHSAFIPWFLFTSMLRIVIFITSRSCCSENRQQDLSPAQTLLSILSCCTYRVTNTTRRKSVKSIQFLCEKMCFMWSLSNFFC